MILKPGRAAKRRLSKGILTGSGASGVRSQYTLTPSHPAATLPG